MSTTAKDRLGQSQQSGTQLAFCMYMAGAQMLESLPLSRRVCFGRKFCGRELEGDREPRHSEREHGNRNQCLSHNARAPLCLIF